MSDYASLFLNKFNPCPNRVDSIEKYLLGELDEDLADVGAGGHAGLVPAQGVGRIFHQRVRATALGSIDPVFPDAFVGDLFQGRPVDQGMRRGIDGRVKMPRLSIALIVHVVPLADEGVAHELPLGADEGQALIDEVPVALPVGAVVEAHVGHIQVG